MNADNQFFLELKTVPEAWRIVKFLEDMEKRTSGGDDMVSYLDAQDRMEQMIHRAWKHYCENRGGSNDGIRQAAQA